MTSSRGLSRLFFTRAWHRNVAQARRRISCSHVHERTNSCPPLHTRVRERKEATQTDAESKKNSGDKTDRATMRSTTHTLNYVCVQTKKRERHNCWNPDKGTKHTRKHGRHKEYKQVPKHDRGLFIHFVTKTSRSTHCCTQKGEKQHPYWQNVLTVQTHYKIRKLSHDTAPKRKEANSCWVYKVSSNRRRTSIGTRVFLCWQEDRSLKWCMASSKINDVPDWAVGFNNLLNTKLRSVSLKMFNQAWEDTLMGMENEPQRGFLESLLVKVVSHEECLGALPFGPSSSDRAKELQKIESHGSQTIWKSQQQERSPRSKKEADRTERAIPDTSVQGVGDDTRGDRRQWTATGSCSRGAVFVVHDDQKRKKRDRSKAKTTQLVESTVSSTDPFRKQTLAPALGKTSQVQMSNLIAFTKDGEWQEWWRLASSLHIAEDSMQSRIQHVSTSLGRMIDCPGPGGKEKGDTFKNSDAIA